MTRTIAIAAAAVLALAALMPMRPAAAQDNTVGGAIIGTWIGQQFNGTLIPNSAAYVVMGVLVLGCVLIAERGRLFGVGVEYKTPPEAAIAE